MNRNVNSDIANKLTHAASRSHQAEERLMQSPAARKDKKNKEEFAKAILSAMDGAGSAEELLSIEIMLQSLDKEKATTAQDKTSIKNAERDYAQIMETVEQMRRSPMEYFRANLSNPETGGDFKKMPRIRGVQQINGNKARMQDRSAFSDENDRLVWDARIVLAAKTERVLKTLHNQLAENYERGMK